VPSARATPNEGHGLHRAAEKREFLEGDGLLAVQNCFVVNAALGAEGAAFALYSTFFRNLFSPQINPASVLEPLCANRQENRRSLHYAALCRDGKFVARRIQLSSGCMSVHGRTNLSSRPERTRISCHATLDLAACAAFVKESRIKVANATKLNRKSGVAEWRDLRFLFASHTTSDG
jgi:hypothetical protein